MNKLNERLTLIANLSVVAGIIFLAVELHQNTQAIQAQTRDSITEKQMMFGDWVGTNRESADLFVRGNSGPDELQGAELMMYQALVSSFLRVWENSHYQYERGLFTAEEYEARLERWRINMEFPGYRQHWEASRETYAASFRAEIDAIVAEVGG